MNKAFWHDKLMDLWMPLVFFSGGLFILGSQWRADAVSWSIHLLPLLAIALSAAGIVGLIAGLMAAIHHGSLRAGLWMAAKVSLGVFIFIVAGAAISTIGNRTQAEIAALNSKGADCGLAGLDEALKMLAGTVVGLFVGLSWGIARGNHALTFLQTNSLSNCHSNSPSDEKPPER
jgi:hypothetical protein